MPNPRSKMQHLCLAVVEGELGDPVLRQLVHLLCHAYAILDVLDVLGGGIVGHRGRLHQDRVGEGDEFFHCSVGMAGIPYLQKYLVKFIL